MVSAMGLRLSALSRLMTGSACLALAMLAPTAALAGGQAAPTVTHQVLDNDALFKGEAQDVQTLAMRAYVWGYPLVQAARIRFQITRPGQPASGPDDADIHAPINSFALSRKLSDHTARMGVGPNNDTLYSLAWMDLKDGPFVLETPDFGDRYYTFSMNQADSAAEYSPGKRTHGRQLPPVFMYGPDYKGPVPDGMLGIPSPTRYLQIAGRFLVSAPSELPAVHALQDKLKLRRWADYQAGRDVVAPPSPQRPLVDAVNPAPEDLRFMEMLGNVLRDWVVAPHDQALIASFARIGLDPARGFDWQRLSAADRAALQRGLREGAELVRRKSLDLGIEKNGWTTNYAGPRFGNDHLLRAAVAKDQIYVAIPEESVYPIGRVDADGQPLDGRKSYRIRMAGDNLPPVDGFWSITVYNDDGFMIDNPIKRYAIGDRTPGLVRDKDGTIEILLQQTQPDPAQKGNWLPTPDGPFYLMMRLYIPRQAILDQSWAPPAIEKITP